MFKQKKKIQYKKQKARKIKIIYSNVLLEVSI